MKKTIEETTRLLLSGNLSKKDADKILLEICSNKAHRTVNTAPKEKK